MRGHFVIFVTGGLRSGKGLFALKTIQDFALQGRRIVTNYDLYLENLLPYSYKNTNITRIPDRPSVEDLYLIGEGYTTENPLDYDEDKFGLIVLDELGTFLNARSWNDKGRKPIVDWLLHSGKRRWCLMLTIQSLELLDNQVHAATANQLVAYCRKLGDMPIPFITPVLQLLTGYRLTIPDSRLATVRLGSDPRGIVSERFFYTGKPFYYCYNTRQEFYPREHESCPRMYTYLSPWHLKGRYKVRKGWAYYKKWMGERVYLLYIVSSLLFLFGVFSFSLSALSFYSASQANDAVRSVALAQKQLKAVLPALPSVSSSVSGLSSPVNEDCAAMKAKFQAFRISGAIQLNKQLYAGASAQHEAKTLYLITDSKTSLTSDDIQEMGFAVNTSGLCEIVLTKNTCIFPLSCSGSIVVENGQPSKPARGEGLPAFEDKKTEKTPQKDAGIMSKLLM